MLRKKSLAKINGLLAAGFLLAVFLLGVFRRFVLGMLILFGCHRFLLPYARVLLRSARTTHLSGTRFAGVAYNAGPRETCDPLMEAEFPMDWAAEILPQLPTDT
jgi:hypothetical protein